MSPLATNCALTVAAAWIVFGVVCLVAHRDRRRAALGAALSFFGVALLASAQDSANRTWLALALGAVVVAFVRGFLVSADARQRD